MWSSCYLPVLVCVTKSGNPASNGSDSESGSLTEVKVQRGDAGVTEWRIVSRPRRPCDGASSKSCSVLCCGTCVPHTVLLSQPETKKEAMLRTWPQPFIWGQLGVFVCACAWPQKAQQNEKEPLDCSCNAKLRKNNNVKHTGRKKSYWWRKPTWLEFQCCNMNLQPVCFKWIFRVHQKKNKNNEWNEKNIAFTALPLSVCCTSSHLPCFNFKPLDLDHFIHS